MEDVIKFKDIENLYKLIVDTSSKYTGYEVSSSIVLASALLAHLIAFHIKEEDIPRILDKIGNEIAKNIILIRNETNNTQH